MTNEAEYNMNHAKRGVALVINMQKYDAPNPFKLQERVWSVKDVENLEKTLNYLEFKVVLCKDKTRAEIEKVLQVQASLDHSESDCFLCVVMSHGNEDRIVTRDNQEMSFEAIMAPIKLCESLREKPKLFFFQACRGESEIEIPRAPKSIPELAQPTFTRQVLNDSHSQSNTNDSLELNKNQKTSIYSESDLLIYNATLPKHYAYGTEANGTYFIKSVCEVLFNEAYKNIPNNSSLSQMITIVNKRVKERENDTDPIQLADPINRLTKEVFFTPKNVCFILKKYKNVSFSMLKFYDETGFCGKV
jgi:hypothetical protein